MTQSNSIQDDEVNADPHQFNPSIIMPHRRHLNLSQRQCFASQTLYRRYSYTN